MYHKITVSSHIPRAKMHKALREGKLSLTKEELNGSGAHMRVHPEVAEKLHKAKKSHKGARFHITKHEIEESSHEGGSIWGFLKSAAKTGYNLVRDNWSSIKPYVSKGLDAAVPAAAAYLGNPELGPLARAGIRAVAGVGVAHRKGGKLVKGSREAKEHMARIRAMRHTKHKGGSFRLE